MMIATHRAPLVRALACLSAGVLTGSVAHAQDAIAIQTMVEQSLFEVRDRVDRNAAAGRRRDEALASAQQRRVDRQQATLEAQALAVRELAGEVRTLRDERRLLQITDSFDAALAASDRPLVRALLADTVTVGARTVAADVLVAELRPRAPTAPPLRANLRVRVDGDRAVVNSDDPPRAGAAGIAGRESREYRFVRAADDWKIDGLNRMR